jgi:dihydrofolate reductase
MLAIITAIDNNWAIGKNNQLLCHLPNDLKYFKEVTEGHMVVMGRKTFESIGKPLPNRKNIVLTRDYDWTAEGVDVVHDIDDVIDIYMSSRFTHMNMFIIGGEQIYTQFIDFVDTLLVTKIYHTFEDSDTYFPPIPLGEWEVVEVDGRKKDKQHKYDYDFVVLNRRTFQ